MKKISAKETLRRFQRLRNYEHLHSKQKEKNAKLKETVLHLKKREKEFEKESSQQEKIIEKLLLELEELKALKFGKRRRIQKDTALDLPTRERKEDKEKKKQRTPESYRRPEPTAEEITDELRMEIKICPECGKELQNKKQHTHYREDLKKAEDILLEAKKVVRTIIESGACQNKKCEFFGQKFFASEIPKQKVIIGENLRQMVVFLSVIQGQSYSETEKSLEHLYGYKISSGHIANILEGESILLTPYYNFLIQSLEEEGQTIGAHYDETTWKTHSQGKEISEGNYCWVKIGTQTNNQLIWFGHGRGKKIAERLRGKRRGSKGITDDYPGYKNTFEIHQLCWSHPHRKLRDLAESNTLSGKTKRICQKAHKDFQELYKRSRKLREKILQEKWNKEKKQKEYQKLEKLFDTLTVQNDSDPEKLRTLRSTLRERKPRYFTFFEFPCMPLDNNKAERAIRKVVIRRKKSLGCKSPKAANVLSILYSVLFSFTENNPDKNFFDLYDEAVEFGGQ